ncbi:MAG: cactus-binding C-terminus of cactin protein-domain-containing protein [Piptocephalis tieghemiana]|nr:MAG: cactus-binding C-terminus of cactin protein-domain-containing protein [Piptocephalis tieghemiana]
MPRSPSPREAYRSEQRARYRERSIDHRREEEDWEQRGGRSREREKGHRSHRARSRDKSGRSRDWDREERSRRHRSSRSRSPSSRKRKKERREREEDRHTQTPPSTTSTQWHEYDPEGANAQALSGTFRWKKKEEEDKRRGVRRRNEKERKAEVAEELRKLSERRAEREREEEEREAERVRIQRENDMAQLGDWEAKETRFHLDQAKRRAEIRMREGRAKPVDLLALLIRLSEEDKMSSEEGQGQGGDKDAGSLLGLGKEEREEIFEGWELSLREPTQVLDGLDEKGVKELHGDIRMYISLESDREYLTFWRAMLIICDDRLRELEEEAEEEDERKKEGDAQVKRRRLGGRIPASVIAEMDRMLGEKSMAELAEIQAGVERKLSGEEGPVDTEYWERLLHSLTIWKARVRVRGMHRRWMDQRLDILQSRQRTRAMHAQVELEDMAAQIDKTKEGQEEVSREEKEKEEEEEEEMEEMVGMEGVLSPKLHTTLPKWASSLRVVTPEEDSQELEEARARVRGQRYIPMGKVRMEGEEKDTSDQEEGAFSMPMALLPSSESGQGVDAEENYNVEALLSKTSYLWQDKYRPRKPRFFNRVHTGYEWNKYNQTHYDHDNPPPKVVQGYKFNLFYPDLIDPTQAPTYRIRRKGEPEGTALIIFTSGPPYEDVAFRIIDREWEYSHKKGFRSSFDRGVLQLHFFFKRHHYRR